MTPVTPDVAFRGGRIASTWKRASALVLGKGLFAALWMAHDPVNDTMYLYDEYETTRPELSIAVEAVRAREPWIPALFDPRDFQRSEQEGARLAQHLNSLGIDVSVASASLEEAIDQIGTRLETGRLKVLSTLSRFVQAMRGLKRDDAGEIVEENTHLIRAAALLVVWGMEVAITENHAQSDREGFDAADYQRKQSPTGY